MQDLPKPVRELLESLERNGFEIARHQRQSKSILHEGATLGGWSTLGRGHWFISHSCAKGHEPTLREHGFRPHTRHKRRAGGAMYVHRVWVLYGPEHVETFRAILSRLSGLPMSASSR